MDNVEEAPRTSETPEHPAAILIVEDEAIVALALRRTLEALGYAVVGMASAGEQALRQVAQHIPDLVLMDLKLAGPMSGIDAAEAIRDRFGVPIIFLTGYVEAEIIQRAKAIGPYGYISKPVRSQDLHATIEMALHHHHLEVQLQAREQWYRTLFESSPISIWEEDFTSVKRRFAALQQAGVDDLAAYLSDHPEEVAHLASLVRILDINQTSIEFFAAADKEALSRSLPTYFTDASLTVFAEEMAALAAGATDYDCEIPIRHPNGEEMWLSLHLAVVPGCEATLSRVIVSFIDITARKRAEAQLQTALRQKEMLLSEINHRVKNNFAVVVGLLQLHAATLRDERAAAALISISHHIQTMTRLHDRLYQLPDLSEIDIGPYIEAIAQDLVGAYGSALTLPVELHLDIDKVYLDIEHALPLCLIINELVSNALKHAFPDDPTWSEGFVGGITIALHQEHAHAYTLTVRDNGIGTPEDFQPMSENSLGTFLVTAFAQQLGGTAAWHHDNGTVCEVRFVTSEGI